MFSNSMNQESIVSIVKWEREREREIDCDMYYVKVNEESKDSPLQVTKQATMKSTRFEKENLYNLKMMWELNVAVLGSLIL